MVALPDGAFVLIRGVPQLRAVKFAAVTADDSGAKNAVAAVFSPQCISPLELNLHHILLLRADNGRMAVFDIVLRNLALVELLLFI